MKKVLVIEDNDQFRHNTMEILLLSDYDVQGAADGRSGIQKAFEFLPDLILCDIELPELDGYGVLQVLRRSAKLKNVLFIFMTGVPRLQDFRSGMSLGADDFICKPFTGTELLNIVNIRFERLKDFLELPSKELLGTDSNLKAVSATHSLFAGAPPVFLRRGVQLYRAGQSISFVSYLMEGHARTSRSNRTDKSLSTGLFKPGQIVGLADFVFGQVWNEDAYTLSDALVISISVDDLRKAIRVDPGLNQLIGLQLAQSVRMKNEELFVMAYQHLRGRIGYTLLSLRESFIDASQEEPYLRITRSNFSTFAGVAKESVTRTLIDFIEEGLIEESHKGFRILNKSKLEVLAGR